MEENKRKPRRRVLLFGLPMLLIVAASCWYGWKVHERQGRRDAIAWVKKMGGSAEYGQVRQTGTGWWAEWIHDFNSQHVDLTNKLVRVDLTDTQVSDITHLAKLKHLQWLWINNTNVRDLSPLTELKNLAYLNLSGTKVSDLTPLEKSKNLTWLNIDNTQVSDLSPLVELTKLTHLYFDNVPVSDLSPLIKLVNLEEVGLKNVEVSEVDGQALRKALPNCRVRSYSTEE